MAVAPDPSLVSALAIEAHVLGFGGSAAGTGAPAGTTAAAAAAALPTDACASGCSAFEEDPSDEVAGPAFEFSSWLLSDLASALLTEAAGAGCSIAGSCDATASEAD